MTNSNSEAPAPMGLGAFRLKVFLIMGLTFGIVLGAANALMGGLRQGVFAGLIGGLLFGIFMAYYLAYRQRGVANTHGWADNEVPAVKQNRDVEVPLAPDAAFELAERAVAALPATVISKDTSTGVIEAKTGYVWDTSWGERLTIQVEPRPSGSVVHIGSRPRMPLTIADLGKNRLNVDSIASVLKA